MASPDELYQLVVEYADLGNHRTGTPADAATTDWLQDQLTRRGADCSRLYYGFDRFEVEAALRAPGGALVPCEPVSHSALADVDTDDLEVHHLPRSVAGTASAMDELLRTPTTAAARVLVLDGPDDLPLACNRPSRPVGKVPAVVVPANRASDVARARLSFRSAVVPGRSAVLEASIGPADGAPVIVTTPTTGWFRCAGERGTGIAVALSVVEHLSQHRRVQVVGCSGHEIDHLGLQHWLIAHDVAGAPVIHLGASVAAVEDPRRPVSFSATRSILVDAEPERRRRIADAGGAAGWSVAAGGPWLGEGGTWRAAGADVLSFVSTFGLFHTTADVPERATTPAALEAACSAVLASVAAFLDGR